MNAVAAWRPWQYPIEIDIHDLETSGELGVSLGRGPGQVERLAISLTVEDVGVFVSRQVRSHRDVVRLSLQITSPRRGESKLKFTAGSEAAMGAWVGDVLPEAQADELRAAIARADKENPV